MRAGFGDASTDATSTDTSTTTDTSAVPALPAASSPTQNVTVNPAVVTSPASNGSTNGSTGGVSVTTMFAIAIGALALGGALVWMFAGTPELSTEKAKQVIRKRRKKKENQDELP
jgi:hypothetical protein